jgi:hypothetical protein
MQRASPAGSNACMEASAEAFMPVRKRPGRCRGATAGHRGTTIAPLERFSGPTATPRRVTRGPERRSHKRLCTGKHQALKRRGRDSNPRSRGYRLNGFQDRRIQPLCHPSVAPRSLVTRQPTANDPPAAPRQGARKTEARSCLGLRLTAPALIGVSPSDGEERLDDRRVELRAGVAAQLRDCGGERHRPPVGTVGRHGVQRVAGENDP